jgi:tRNA dimethylallyltransferase
MKPKLIVILGPTAVGKSALALELAVNINAEIISADSQLVYRGLNIGTAKPSLEEREKIPHHLLDVINPDEEFNAAIYRRLAMAAAEDIWRRGKNALVCGGSGLYVKALTEGLFTGPQQDSMVREELESEIEKLGLAALYGRLERVDPTATTRIHPHDRQRIIRALEVFQLTGRPMSEWQKAHAFKEGRFTALRIGLYRERGDLYNRINLRCEQMIAAGLLQEVSNLVNAGYGLNLKPLRSVGYRHMGLVLKGEMEMNQALELMQRDSRRLAKRQLTWFRGDGEILWWHPDDKEKIFASIVEFLGSDQKESM